MAVTASQAPRYEAHENPPLFASLGYGLQFSLIASATLLVTPVVVAKASGRDASYLVWMVFASLLVCGLLDEASEIEPKAAPLTALATLAIVAALALRGSELLRLWAPLIGIVGGCIVAAMLGIYDMSSVREAPWVGLPSEWPGLALDFSIPFWTLLPSFLFLGVIISIQANGADIAMQRVSWRDDRAVDFRQVQGALAGTGATNLMAGIAGAVPNIINPGTASFTQITGVASRRVGYCIGGILIVLAFLPKASGLLNSIPGPVMTG